MDKIEKRIIDNMPLVTHVVKRLSIDYDDFEDCLQIGNEALCKAAARFDDNKGIAFSTFAVSYIRNSILTYLRESNSVHISRNVIDRISQCARKNQCDKFSLTNEMLSIDNISLVEYQQFLNASKVRSIFEQVKEDTTVSDFIKDDNDDLSKSIAKSEIFEAVDMVLQKYPDKKRDICEDFLWSNIYGEKIIQEEFAKKYECSQTSVSRIIRNFKKDVKKCLLLD